MKCFSVKQNYILKLCSVISDECQYRMLLRVSVHILGKKKWHRVISRDNTKLCKTFSVVYGKVPNQHEDVTHTGFVLMRSVNS